MKFQVPSIRIKFKDQIKEAKFIQKKIKKNLLSLFFKKKYVSMSLPLSTKLLLGQY